MFEESLADKLPTAYATIQQPVPKCYGKSNEGVNSSFCFIILNENQQRKNFTIVNCDINIEYG